MPRFLASLTVLGFSLNLALGQQTGDANRDYAINGWSFGSTSGQFSMICPTPGTMNNAYRTLDPFAPVVWARSPQTTIGAVSTTTNSFDLNLGNLQIIGSGLAPGLLGGLFHTDGSGNLDLAVHAAPGTTGFNWYAMGHAAASSPDGFWVSQVTGCRFSCQATQNIAAGDDTTHEIPLVRPIFWYGSSYTSIFVNSNGNVTFGSGDTSYTETVAAFLSGPPRFAPLWDDLSPNAGGQISINPANSSNLLFELCFTDIPEYASGGSNSFLVRFFQDVNTAVGGQIQTYYGNVTAMDGLVGVSPGSNLDPSGLSLDLNTASTSISAGTAVYELFDGSNPTDLSGDIVFMWMDGAGYPTGITQF